jgi:hypothetical protein
MNARRRILVHLHRFGEHTAAQVAWERGQLLSGLGTGLLNFCLQRERRLVADFVAKVGK